MRVAVWRDAVELPAAVQKRVLVRGLAPRARAVALEQAHEGLLRLERACARRVADDAHAQRLDPGVVERVLGPQDLALGAVVPRARRSLRRVFVLCGQDRADFGRGFVRRKNLQLVNDGEGAVKMFKRAHRDLHEVPESIALGGNERLVGWDGMG